MAKTGHLFFKRDRGSFLARPAIYAGAFLVFCAGAIIGNIGSAEASKIRCKDGYQIVQGNLLATPYCQEDQLARVAREYGMKASASKIRSNPNFKDDVCRFIGHDIRVQDTCAGSRSGRGGGGFR